MPRVEFSSYNPLSTWSKCLYIRCTTQQSATHAVGTSPFDVSHPSICVRQQASRSQSPQNPSPPSSPNATSLPGPPHSSTPSIARDPHFLEILTANVVNLPAINAPAPASTITNKPTTPNDLVIGNPMVRYNNPFNKEVCLFAGGHKSMGSCSWGCRTS